MSKTAHILAVDDDNLPDVGSGFFPIGEALTLDRLQKAGLYIGPRPLLEEDERFRQIIPYVLLCKRSPELGVRFATYTRGASGNEGRLHGKLSIGVGGHIDLPDIKPAEDGSIDLEYTLRHAAVREVSEEVVMGVQIGVEPKVDLAVTKCVAWSTRWAGVLIDDADAVGRVHIGIVGIAVVPCEFEVSPGEESQEDIQWLTKSELQQNQDRLEGWTALLLPSLQQIVDLETA